MLRPIHDIPLVIRPLDDLVQTTPDLEDMSRDLAKKYAEGEIVTDDDLQNMGDMLWETLCIQNDFDVACRAAGKAILTVVIESTSPDVQALPWETLHHPVHGFLGKHPCFTLTRRIPTGRSAQASLEKGPLRVLLFTSLVDDPGASRLNVEEEQARMQEALLPWIEKGRVELEMPDDGRFSTLKSLLEGFRPHVLFLSGHGQFKRIPHENKAYGEFLFEDEAGNKKAIREDEIANVLAGTGVQAVILSACESGQAASDVLASGLMRSISVNGIPHVIGMRESVIEAAGIQFARTLCRRLARRERMDVAVQAARMAIRRPLKDTSADERSLGQWCLPMLISPTPEVPLIDWDFQPKKVDGARRFKNTVGSLKLPERFIGRRAELRLRKSKLFKGELHKLLITGPGGQGKTSLAGKLALDLQKRDGQVFAWSAKQNDSWYRFELELEQALSGPRLMRYNRLSGIANEYDRAKSMLDLLMEQYNQQVVLVLDNLESIQDPSTQALNDPLIAAWIQAARETPNLILLATSRWKIPGWDGDHLELTGTSYSDFLQMAQGFGLRSSILKTHGGLRHVHSILGGNSRGLEFFAAAVTDMRNPEKEHPLLEALAKTKADVQADMAIAEIYKRLPLAAQKLLQRLPAYHQPIPLEGFIRLGADLPEPQKLLERLLNVSLLEASDVQHGHLIQYQCHPLVRDWLEAQKLSDVNPVWLNMAADYYLDLFLQDRRALSRAIAAYHAFRHAENHDKADFLAWKDIVGPLTKAGSYASLLKEWLPDICSSQDSRLRGKALSHKGLLLKNTGEYEEARKSLEQALAIQRDIHDQAGEATTLNHLAMTYQRQGAYETALTHLELALSIQQQIADRKGQARTLNHIAQMYHRQGDYEKVLDHLNQTLAIQQETGDQNRGTTLNDLSQIFKAQGEYETALERLRQALVIQQQSGDKPGESVTLNNISGIYHRRNEYETALKYLKQALAIQRRIGNRAGEAITLNNIAGIYQRQGEFDPALEYLGEARTIQEQTGDKAGQGMTLNNIASVYQARGVYETALSNYRQALAIRLELRDQAGEAQTLNNLGTLLQTQGEYEPAQKNFERALVLTKKMGSQAGESTALSNIGTLLQVQGKYAAALENFEQALTLKQKIGDRIGEAATLNNIGTVHEAQGDDQAALSAYNRALAIRRQIRDREGEAQSLNNLSKLARAPDEYQAALDDLEYAQTIQEQIGARPGLCITFLNLGHLHRQNGKLEKAIESWLNAYVLARDMKLERILQDLEKFASTVELRKGREDWEALAQKKKSQQEKTG